MTALNPDIALDNGEKLMNLDPGSAGYAPAPTRASAITPPSTTPSKEQDQKGDAQSLIDGSKKTWGEKVYHNVVYRIFGFGVNLGVSSYLTYWINHSERNVPFTQSTPHKASESLKSWFNKSWVTKNPPFMKEVLPEVRANRAKVMGNALILTMGGHILIPIVKLFEDHKTGIVKWLDEKHYGKEGVEDPGIQAAHERVAQELRPTWLSTALARIVSIGAVQISARTIGTKENFIKRIGEKGNIPYVKDYPGIDRGAEEMGAAVVEKGYLNEGLKNATNSFLVKSTRSPGRITDSIGAGITKTREPATMLLKYGFSDIIYTIITAAIIQPTNSWFIRNFSFLRKEPENPSGDTHTPVVRKGVLLDATTSNSITVNARPAATANDIPSLDDKKQQSDAPSMQVSAIQRDGQLHQEQMREKA